MGFLAFGLDPLQTSHKTQLNSVETSTLDQGFFIHRLTIENSIADRDSLHFQTIDQFFHEHVICKVL